MTKHQSSILKQVLNVAFATLLSRVLGLFRVVFESMTLGGGVLASAWQLAFMIPNMFRRLLGEGALGSALIPVLIHTEEKEGLAKMREDLSVVFAVLGGILALIVVVFSLVSMYLASRVSTAYWQIALRILPVLMPYAFLICFSGVIGAVLNSRKVFFLPALMAVLLNIFLISGLAVGFLANTGKLSVLPDFADWLRNGKQLLDFLASLVLVSGIIQLGLSLILLKKVGIFPVLRKSVFRDLSVLRELWKLVLPGLIGGAALQVSFLADRVLASWLGPQAVPALVYTDRLIDLPIGLLAIGIGSVLMTNMARSAAQGNNNEVSNDLSFGLRLIWFCCIPMAFFVVVFREPVLRLLLCRGNFTEADLQEAAQATLFLGMGLPFFCSLKAILPVFYAWKQVNKVLKVSILCILANIVMNLILMWPLKQGGIALATVLSSVLNNTLLLILLARAGLDLPVARWIGSFLRAVLAAGIAGTAGFLLQMYALKDYCSVQTGLMWVLPVLLLVFSGVYIAVHLASGGRESMEFFHLLRQRSKR